MNRLIHYEPFRGLRRELDRLFDDSTTDLEGVPPSGLWTPGLDLAETETAFVMRMDLPGLKPEEVEVSVLDDQLVIRGERTHSASEASERIHRIERSYGSFFRALTLPRTADSEHMDATLEDGVLTLTMPKTEESQPRHIEVGGAKELMVSTPN